MKINITDYEMNDIVKTICELAGVTQEEFDETVRGHEDGKLRYTFETVMKIVDDYGLTITINKGEDEAE